MGKEKLRKLADVCTLCGSCNSSCPVFGIEQAEPYSPRGRINLIAEILKGSLEDSETIREIMSVCLMCGYCENSCSRGVDFMAIFRGYLDMPVTPDKGKKS